MFAVAWLQRDWCSIFVLALGHFLWQGILIAILVSLGLRFTKSVSARYWLSLSGLVIMAACPIGTVCWTWHPVPPTAGPVNAPISATEADFVIPEQPRTVDVGPTPRIGALSVRIEPDNPPIADSENVTLPTNHTSVATAIDERDEYKPSWQRIAPPLTCLYLIGVSVMLARLIVGVRGGRRLRCQATPVADRHLQAALQRQAAALGLKFLPLLAYCERVTVPTVIGVLKPTILLPLSLATGLTSEQIESVLAHELAHLKRHDPLIDLLQRVIESFLFFHPAVWWLSRRIRNEREHCCDDLVVACGAVPFDYAHSLLRVAELSRNAEQLRGRQRRRSVTGAGLLATGGRPSTLRERIARLLGDHEMNVRTTHPWLLGILAAVCLGIVWSLTAMDWIALAETNPDDAVQTTEAQAPDPKPDLDPNAVLPLIEELKAAVGPSSPGRTNIQTDKMRAVADTLGRSGDSRAIVALLERIDAVVSSNNRHFGEEREPASSPTLDAGLSDHPFALPLFHAGLTALPELSKGLVSSSLRTRQVCAWVLSNLSIQGGLEPGDFDNIRPELLAGLRDKDPVVRFCVLRTINPLKLPGAEPILLELLESPLPDDTELPTTKPAFAATQIQVEVIRCLSGLKSDAVREALLGALRHRESAVRSAAAGHLGAIPGETTVLPLIKALSDPGASAEAARVLGHVGDPRAIESLIENLNTSLDMTVRVNATQSLGLLGAADAKTALRDVLTQIPAVNAKSDDFALQCAAAISLAQLHDEAGAQRLKQLLGSDDYETRSIVAAHLGTAAYFSQWRPAASLSHEPTRDVLRHFAEYAPDTPTRLQLLNALGGQLDETTRQFLERRARDLNEPIRWAAWRVLVRPNPASYEEVLLELLGQNDDNVRGEVISFLGQIATKTATDRLLALAADSNPEIREAVARALGRHRSPIVDATLLDLSRNDPSPHVRVRAARILTAKSNSGDGEPRSQRQVRPNVALVETSLGSDEGLSAIQVESNKVLTPVDLDVHGTIENTDGSPAVGATVVAVRVRPVAAHDVRLKSTTDEQGHFSLRLNGVTDVVARWHLFALKDDHSGEASKSLTIPKGRNVGLDRVKPAVKQVVIRLKSGRAISGTVFDEGTREPISGAKIYSLQGQLVITDARGRFELRGVPADIEQLYVTSPGKAGNRIYIDVSERATADIDVFLAPGGRVQGRVLDQKDRPVIGATVFRWTGNLLTAAATAATTDINGRFILDGLPVKSLLFPLDVNAPGLEVRHSEFVVIRETRQATEVVIRMDKPVNHQVSVLRASLAGDNVPPAGAIRGRVVDPRGRRVRNFTVTLLPVTDNEPRDSGSYGNPSRQFSDHDGQFVIGRLGADKRYRVSVSATGFGRAVVEPIYARLETTIKDRDIIEFRLLPPHVARIHVIDAETKVPIPDIMVGVIDNSRLRQLFEWNLTMVGARTEWTSADGTATFENLASEIVPVFVESPGYARTHAVWKKLPGESIESGLDRIEIALQKEAQLQIRLANPGFRDVRTLHAGLTSPAKEEFQSDSADVGRPAKIRFRQLPPGKYSLSIFDAAIKEPWTPLTTQDVELKPGDNDVTIDLTANR